MRIIIASGFVLVAFGFALLNSGCGPATPPDKAPTVQPDPNIKAGPPTENSKKPRLTPPAPPKD